MAFVIRKEAGINMMFAVQNGKTISISLSREPYDPAQRYLSRQLIVDMDSATMLSYADSHEKPAFNPA